MKSLTDTINENLQASVVLNVLDKRNVKTFASKQEPVKVKGTNPQYLIYQVKDGEVYVYFSTKRGMLEFVQTSLEEKGKQTAQEIARLKVGESLKIEDGSIWIRLE